MRKMYDISELNLTIEQLKKFSTFTPFEILNEGKEEDDTIWCIVSDRSDGNVEILIEADKDGNIVKSDWIYTK